MTRMTGQQPPAMSWSLAGASHPNPKGKPNQDAVYYTPHPLHTPAGALSALALICDGVSGQPGGEEAGALAVERLQATLSPLLQRDDLTAEAQQDALVEALAAADRAIFGRNQALGRPPQERMTTTALVAWLYADRAVVAHVGDSRAYAWTPDRGLSRLTTDHTALELDLRRGLIRPEEAAGGRYHGGEALTQALGLRERVVPDAHLISLHPGLTLLLCSDGVYKPLGDERLAHLLARQKRGRPAALVRTVFKEVRRRQGQDDATLVVVQIE